MLMSANNREGGDGKGIRDEEEPERSIYHIRVNFEFLEFVVQCTAPLETVV
jgi:hypothetical protein